MSCSQCHGGDPKNQATLKRLLIRVAILMILNLMALGIVHNNPGQPSRSVGRVNQGGWKACPCFVWVFRRQAGPQGPGSAGGLILDMTLPELTPGKQPKHALTPATTWLLPQLHQSYTSQPLGCGLWLPPDTPQTSYPAFK